MMIKGQLEEEVKALHFPKLINFTPPALERKRSDRKLEVMATKALYFFNRSEKAYSCFRASTGLSRTVRQAWYPTVASETARASRAADTNGNTPMSTR